MSDWAAVEAAFLDRAGFSLPDAVVLLGSAGSQAHGTTMVTAMLDDVDLMGVVVPPPHRVLGGLRSFESIQIQLGVYDLVVYSLQHYVRLLVKANPNVLGLLWLPPEQVVRATPIGEALRAERHRFLTRRVYPAFTGYAYGQLKRMTSFDLSRMDAYDAYQRAITAAGLDDREVLAADANKLTHLQAQAPGLDLAGFRTLHKRFFSGYMGVKRKAMVRRYGYDTKNAAHLIRLLRMGTECLREGGLQVDRRSRDADELLAIKQGAWTLAQVQEEATRLFAEAELALAACTLPEEPDLGWIEDQVVAWHCQHYAWGPT